MPWQVRYTLLALMFIVWAAVMVYLALAGKVVWSAATLSVMLALTMLVAIVMAARGMSNKGPDD